MKFGRLLSGRFLERPNRFGAYIESAGRRVYVHVPNSGRLAELLVPGAAVRWQAMPGRGRKTEGDLVLVRAGRGWVCIDAMMPPILLAEAVAGPKGIEPFGHSTEFRFEPSLGKGRVDLALSSGDTWWLIETKSVTLARDGVAMFPDAPTQRGRRHLQDLAALLGLGGAKPAVAFVCQRPDVYCFRPNSDTDPAFAAALQEAARAGVLVVAYRCHVGPRGIAIADQIEVRLGEDELSCGGPQR